MTGVVIDTGLSNRDVLPDLLGGYAKERRGKRKYKQLQV
jgi:hypothetical protein